MAIRIIEGYVEPSITRPRGGRSASNATSRRDAAAERISELVGGIFIGRGVENTDSLKKGYLTPETRVVNLMVRIRGLKARIEKTKRDPDITPKKRDLLLPALVQRLSNAQDEVLSIQADLTKDEEFLAEE